jgi:hypothetical protein
MLSLGAVSYPSGLGFGCKAGRWEFESQLDPLLLMLCEESELPWWLKVSLLPEISKKTKQQPKREKKERENECKVSLSELQSELLYH